MSPLEWGLGVLIILAFIGINIFLNRWQNRELDKINKRWEFENLTRSVSPIVFLGVGLVTIISSVIRLPSVPEGNEFLIYLGIGFGVLLILYGLLKWHRLGKSR
jgi:4-hydroxybenzoate polyprenyltransferase